MLLGGVEMALRKKPAALVKWIVGGALLLWGVTFLPGKVELPAADGVPV